MLVQNNLQGQCSKNANDLKKRKRIQIKRKKIDIKRNSRIHDKNKDKGKCSIVGVHHMTLLCLPTILCL